MRFPEEIDVLLEDILSGLTKSSSNFQCMEPPGTTTHPIPFFGRIDTAEVLTVGVNPSSGEFRSNRWPAKLSITELRHRLVHYFDKPQAEPHQWFDVWEQGLQNIGYSYYDGTAAHIDISPRATISMGKCDPDQFVEMCLQDVPWMFRLLEIVDSPKLLMMAGTVTKLHYVNDFLKLVAGKNNWMFLGEGQTKGQGRVGYHSLWSGSQKHNAFFCSVGPSAKTERHILIERIMEHSSRILRLHSYSERSLDDAKKTHPRRQLVTLFLRNNVKVWKGVGSVTLSDFKVDWDSFRGDFVLALDSEVLPERISFGIEACGNAHFYLPSFNSLYGAPASFGAIEIADRTYKAIEHGLRKTIPRIKGTGIDRDTGQEIRFHTPPILRINRADLEKTKQKVNSDYLIKVNLCDL